MDIPLPPLVSGYKWQWAWWVGISQREEGDGKGQMVSGLCKLTPSSHPLPPSP